MSSIITIHNLNKTYDGSIEVLRNVNLQITRSTINAFIGKTGAGKTTLLRCLNLLEVPSAGDVFVNDTNIVKISRDELNRLRKKIGIVFQSLNLLNSKTVAENIALPLVLANVSKMKIKQKVAKLVKLVGLEGQLNSYPSNLSGGQQQRVAIARALATDAEILLCDEFTSALDPETTLEILQLLKDLNNQLGVTIVIITHDMDVVREICDYVFVLEDGELKEQGIVENIFYDPQQPITKSLINSMFAKDIPQVIKARLTQKAGKNCQVIMRLFFSSSSSGRPIISEAVRKFKMDVNIIAGHLDHIRTSTFGSLIISLDYDQAVYKQFSAFLAEHNVKSENVGYLPC